MLSLIILRYYTIYLLTLHSIINILQDIFLKFLYIYFYFLVDVICSFVRKGTTKMSEIMSDIIWSNLSPEYFCRFFQTVILRKLKTIVCRLLLLCKTRNRTKILLKIDFFTYKLLPRKSGNRKGKNQLWNLFS